MSAPHQGRGALARAERAQALVAVVGLIALLMVGVGVLGSFGKALLGKGRQQRAADLAAISAARSMSDDFTRLFEPLRDARGRRNPRHLALAQYLARAREVAFEAARLNGADPRRMTIGFDGRDGVPTRVRIKLRGAIELRQGGRRRRVAAASFAEAELAPVELDGGPAGEDGYSGRLAYRQGKPMRPDVALAFDRMDAAARRDGVELIISSGYRSDEEQARLFARHPDPRWVAPPGRSLHRNATELDLGPPGAYGWLARNAERFHFVQRYSWEAWH